jgi:hypothetical protein
MQKAEASTRAEARWDEEVDGDGDTEPVLPAQRKRREMAAGYVVLARYDGQWSSRDEGDDSPPFDGLGAGDKPVSDVTVSYHSTLKEARTEAARRGDLDACLYVHIAKLLDEEV